jgi:hypothetical protein
MYYVGTLKDSGSTSCSNPRGYGYASVMQSPNADNLYIVQGKYSKRYPVFLEQTQKGDLVGE